MNGFQNQYAENMALNSHNQNYNMSSDKHKIKKKKSQKHGQDKSNEEGTDDNTFNLYQIGKIKYAKLNQSATRPLKQIKEIDENANIEKCPCCQLPVENKEYFQPFKTCDDPDEFSNCGQGVTLYYTFIKFIITVLFITSVCISLVNIYFSYKYTYELKEVCNNYYINGGNDIDECKYYITESNESSTVEDSFFFQFSPTNIKHYRKIFNKINTNQTGGFESTIINLSRTNFGCLAFVFIFNLVFILFLYNKANTVDYLVLTVSDYSVFLYNLYDVHSKFLSLNKGNKNNKPEVEEFKDFLKTKICTGNYGENLVINRVDLCYKLKDLMKLQEKYEDKNIKIWKVKNKITIENREIEEDEKKSKEEKEKEKKDPESDDNVYEGSCFSCDDDKGKTIGQLKEEKEELSKKIKDLISESNNNTLDYFGGSAFITMETLYEQELYLKNIPKNAISYFFYFLKNLCYMLTSCCGNKDEENLNYLRSRVKYIAAPEPEDIIFENLEISQCERLMRTILVYIISIIICAVSFAIIVGFNKLQEYIDGQDNSNHVLLMYIISFAITGAQSAFNIILENVLQFLTDKERQNTMTDYYLSYSIKLTFFYFLNDALLPIFSEIFFIQSDGYEILISNMIMKFAINAFVSPLLWRINISYYLKKIQICLFIKEGKIKKTQKELNDLFEYPPMNVSVKYSYIFKTLLMSFLFIPIFPLGLAISFVGFIFAYWVEKYNFANIYKKPEMLNKSIVEAYVNFFVLVLFAYGIGDYIFLSDAYDTRLWSLLNIIVFGVLIIIPYHQLLSHDFLEVDEFALYKNNYNDIYYMFNSDYERANPMTKIEGMKRYNKELLDRGIINQEDYNSIVSSLDSVDFMEIYYRQRKGSKRRGFINNNFGFRGPNQFGPRRFPGFGFNYGFNYGFNNGFNQFQFPHPHGNRMFFRPMNPTNININPPQNQIMNKGYSSNNQPNNQMNNDQNKNTGYTSNHQPDNQMNNDQNKNNGYTSNNQPNNQMNNYPNNYSSNYSNTNQIMPPPMNNFKPPKYSGFSSANMFPNNNPPHNFYPPPNNGFPPQNYPHY